MRRARQTSNAPHRSHRRRSRGALSQARLPDHERALLLFVLRAVRVPEDVSAEEVQALRALGWSDEHIFEATYYGGWMLLLGLLFYAFKMDEASPREHTSAGGETCSS